LSDKIVIYLDRETIYQWEIELFTHLRKNSYKLVPVWVTPPEIRTPSRCFGYGVESVVPKFKAWIFNWDLSRFSQKRNAFKQVKVSDYFDRVEDELPEHYAESGLFTGCSHMAAKAKNYVKSLVLRFNYGGLDPGHQMAWENELFNSQSILTLDIIHSTSAQTWIGERIVGGTDALSITRGMHSMLFRTPGMVVRSLENPARRQKEGLSETVVSSHTTGFLWGIGKKYYKKVVDILKSRNAFKQWILLYNRNIDPNLSGINLEGATRIAPPAGTSWADPFIVEDRGRTFLFVEEYPLSTKRGRISVMEIYENGRIGESRVVLDKDYHLSFPNVFRWEDSWYMIPESSANQTIELYKATDFPYSWQKVTNLMEGVRAVDSDVVFSDNRFWMFTNVENFPGAGVQSELMLYHKKSLIEGDWHGHPGNPIVSDIRFARLAGKIRLTDGKLIRVCQDGARHYGHGMHFFEITELTTSSYSEQLIGSKFPQENSDLLGVHTFNLGSMHAIMDALHWEPRPRKCKPEEHTDF
jgi:hypothetical protein